MHGQLPKLFPKQTVSATRSDVLAGGAAYPALTITVSVAGNIASIVTNTATVAGGAKAGAAMVAGADCGLAEASVPRRSKHADIS